ncbi:hypothetical protein DE146DRAFT_674837 [Phaeosphaeria sp. MPI-PUGE-AT-0046c]|nr:hypothetical protein DE146DRAFT_674837 [Phaeosphaeria sp. MPI-PUGE-AT-0046c]
MELSFVDKVAARDAYHSCHDDNGGLIITSHESCNKEGERAVYTIEDVYFTNEGESLELSVTEASWQSAFDDFAISFGHTTDDHLLRRHSAFSKTRKRQAPNVAIPADTPDTVIAASFDLKSELIDTTFAAPSFLAGLEALVPIPALPIEIGCKNCSTRGKVALTQGAIVIDASQIDLIPDIFQGGDDGKEITSVITGGFIELSATGLGARLELFARPQQSGAFEISLFSLPVVGFVIPGIGRAGAVFEGRIVADYEISGGFELNYGIDVAVPDTSAIRLELTNIANSGVTGFPGSTLTPLPFQANVTDVDIKLGLAFKPTIPVGFEFANKLNAEVLVSMNLPRLDARLSTNPAKDCGVGNSSNITMPSAPYSNGTTPSPIALGPLTLVEANVSISVDVGLGLKLPLLPPPINDVGIEANVFSAVFPLVTGCADAGKQMPPMTIPTQGWTMGNATSTPCANETVYVTTTATETKTVRMTHASMGHATTTLMSSHSTQTTHVSLMPGPSPVVISHSTKVEEVKKSSAASSSPSQPILTTSANATTVAASTTSQFAPSQLPPALAQSQPPVPAVIMSTGFLNISGVPAQQSGAPAVFTGAASPALEVPTGNRRALAWQMGIIGLAILGGVMVL